jgi:hypothetical protein
MNHVTESGKMTMAVSNIPLVILQITEQKEQTPEKKARRRFTSEWRWNIIGFSLSR